MPSIHAPTPSLDTRVVPQVEVPIGIFCKLASSHRCPCCAWQVTGFQSQLQQPNNILNSHKQAISLAVTCFQERFLVFLSQVSIKRSEL